MDFDYIRNLVYSSDEILDSFGEIANISTRLFNHSYTPHVSLGKAYLLPAQLPHDVLAFMESPAERLDLDIAIQDYGSGRLSLLSR